jgi:hypothetical protein
MLEQVGPNIPKSETDVSSVYQIFTNLGHMISLWKGKNPIYFGVIRSKVKVTINIIFKKTSRQFSGMDDT